MGTKSDNGSFAQGFRGVSVFFGGGLRGEREVYWTALGIENFLVRLAKSVALSGATHNSLALTAHNNLANT